jgi:hypothetical protein
MMMSLVRDELALRAFYRTGYKMLDAGYWILDIGKTKPFTSNEDQASSIQYLFDFCTTTY